jgi:hypothetical protein
MKKSSFVLNQYSPLEEEHGKLCIHGDVTNLDTGESFEIHEPLTAKELNLFERLCAATSKRIEVREWELNEGETYP